MDENDDEISEWAKNLTPEGSPGKLGEYLRATLGDKRYEEELEYNNKVREIMIARNEAVNNLLTAGVAFLVFYGLVGLVAAIAVTVKFIF